jgi:ATP-dependent DNA helicase 2 subunit 2
VSVLIFGCFGANKELRNKVEYAPIDETFSPIIHRVNQAVAFRAVHPDAPFDPTVPDALTRFSRPPQRLVDKAKPHIDALKSAAKVQKGTSP